MKKDLKLTWRSFKRLKRKDPALAPQAAAFDGQGAYVCWYEYTGRDRPLDSRLFGAWYRNQRFGRVRVIESARGFNNGPCIVKIAKDRAGLLWHSWRKPGKLPFKGEDICHVWSKTRNMRSSADDRAAARPFRPLKNTLYASCSKSPKGGFVCSYIHRRTNRVHLAGSQDFTRWKTLAVHRSPRGVIYADSIIGANGFIHLVYVTYDKGNVLKLTTWNPKQGWSEPRTVLREIPNPARPRISMDGSGRMWLTCHSDDWDPAPVDFNALVRNGKLEIKIEPGELPGCSHWAWNGVTVMKRVPRRTPKVVRRIWFGSDGGDDRTDPKTTILEPGQSLYDRHRGCGFDRPVQWMRRSRTSLQRQSMFYSRDRRTFIVDLPNGRYRVRCLISSWLTSLKDSRLSISSRGGNIDTRQDPARKEAIYISSSRDGTRWATPYRIPFKGLEANRPSKIEHDAEGNYHRLFFTGVDRQGIHLWAGEFKSS